MLSKLFLRRCLLTFWSPSEIYSRTCDCTHTNNNLHNTGIRIYANTKEQIGIRAKDNKPKEYHYMTIDHYRPLLKFLFVLFC